MNSPGDQGLTELLQVVEKFRERQRDEILRNAQTQAHEIIRHAYQKARARLHQSILEEREHGFRELISAEAQLQTRQRQLRQQDDLALLQQVWPRLEQALLVRWRDAAQRAQWIRQLHAAALRALPAAPWKVVHPADWPRAEQQALLAAIQQDTGHAPQLLPDPAVAAGLRIEAAGACLDGTLAGLLVNRSATEALLLAYCHRARATPGHCATP